MSCQHNFYISVPKVHLSSLTGRLIRLSTLGSFCLSTLFSVPLSVNAHTFESTNLHSPSTKANLSQSCTELETKRQIERLSDFELSPIKKLISCGLVAIPELIKMLNHEDWQIRVVIIYILGEIDSASLDIVPNLIDATQDNNHDVRLSAVIALGKIAEDNSVSALTQALQDKNRNVRLSAINALLKLSPQVELSATASLALLEALKTEYLPVRFTYQLSPEYLGSQENRELYKTETILALFAALGASDWSIRHHAAEALIAHIDKDKNVILMLLSEHFSLGSDPGGIMIQGQIEFIASQIGVTSLINVLNVPVPGNFQDEYLSIEHATIEILSNLRSKDAIQFLINRSQDDTNLKLEAIEAFISSKSIPFFDLEHYLALDVSKDSTLVDIVPLLIKHLNDQSYSSRLAAPILAKIGTQEAVSALVQALNSDNSNLRSAALFAFGTVEPEDSTLLFNETRRQLELTFINILKAGGLGAENDESLDFTRLYSASALGFIGLKVLPNLTRNLSIEEGGAAFIEANLDYQQVRYSHPYSHYYRGCPAVNFFGPERDDFYLLADAYFETLRTSITPYLISTLTDEENSEYVLEAIESLGALKVREAVPYLVEILQPLDKRKDIVAWKLSDAALRAIENIGAEESILPLTQLLHDESKSISLREQVVETLGQIGSAEAIPSLVLALQTQQSRLELHQSSRNLDEEFDSSYYEELHFKDEIALALSQLGSSLVLPTLVSVMRESNDINTAWRRFKVVENMRYLQEPAVPYLIESLVDRDWEFSYMAADSLAYIGPESVPELVKQLKMLINLPPALRLALRDKNLQARRNLIYVLSRIGEPAQEAVELLTAISENPVESSAIRQMADFAVSQIAQPDNKLDIARSSMMTSTGFLSDESLYVYIGNRVYSSPGNCGDGSYTIYQRLQELLGQRKKSD